MMGSTETEKAILIILDGWGLNEDENVSAIAKAKTPVMDRLLQEYPSTTLVTYGSEVGLPEGQMGNSEVGHLNIGAGRVVYQELARINKAIKDDTIKSNEVLVKVLEKAKATGQRVHLMGLLSDGGVHSHIEHIKAFAGICHEYDLEEVFIHAFLDGRDCSPTAGVGFIQKLEEHIHSTKVKLATIIGRYYAMDRDERWERTRRAYKLLVDGQAESVTSNPTELIQNCYNKGITDEFMEAIKVEGVDGRIGEGDLLLFLNFRTDRPRQLSRVLTQENIPDFEMKKLALDFVTMTTYDSSYKNVQVLFTKDNIKKTIGEVVSEAGLSQVRIAETEKYPHVTFFFNGGREEPFSGEQRIMVSSPKVATYDLQPEMSAQEITDKLKAHLTEEHPDLAIVNYANTDMVGHTGIWEAGVKAAEVVDGCLGSLLETCLVKDYHVFVIADHGNSDIMVNSDGSPHTAHTLNPVPLIYIKNGREALTLKQGKLADIAPSMLSVMNVAIPEEMTGEVLVAKES